MPGVILIGITALANKASYQPELQDRAGFFMFIGSWLNENDFFISGLMYLLILAAIAGIMSTADSSLIGISNTVSVNIFPQLVIPNASPRQTILFGKLVSIFSALMAAGIAVYLEVTKPAGGKLFCTSLSTGWHWLANFACDIPLVSIQMFQHQLSRVGALGIGSFLYWHFIM